MNRNRRQGIESQASRARFVCGLPGYGIEDVFHAAESLGYRMIRYPYNNKMLAGIAWHRDSERIIISNSAQVLSREIFTVAHEIGHHILHISGESDSAILDDDLSDRTEIEVEANYFAANFLMPQEEIEKYIRLHLMGKPVRNWNGLDIASIQTTFKVSFDMTITRLLALNILDQTSFAALQQEKIKKTATRLLFAIHGNVTLCEPSFAKQIPVEYLAWVVSNYQNKLIPKSSLEYALQYIGLHADEIDISDNDNDLDTVDELLERME